ncbi:MAG: hypothetical protein ACLQVN_27665 [Bryobacteraceae bacterium]
MMRTPPDATVMIGIQPAELPWLRMLVALLRHPHPATPELTRRALLYLHDAAAHAALHPTAKPDDDYLHGS